MIGEDSMSSSSSVTVKNKAWQLKKEQSTVASGAQEPCLDKVPSIFPSFLSPEGQVKTLCGCHSGPKVVAFCGNDESRPEEQVWIWPRKAE